jgi:hypothetical protein
MKYRDKMEYQDEIERRDEMGHRDKMGHLIVMIKIEYLEQEEREEN